LDTPKLEASKYAFIVMINTIPEIVIKIVKINRVLSAEENG
jgi:hypothetical protein